MVQRAQFRKVLPVFQTALGILFGGWGIWERNTVISNSWLGWNSTLPFHFWPWPFKFAAILNMPAFLAGALLSWPLDYLLPRLPDWVSVLLFIPFLWYWMGSWADKYLGPGKDRNVEWGRWTVLLLFMIICAGASSIPQHVGGYTGYVVFGNVIWLIVAIAMKATTTLRRRRAELI